MKRSLRRLLYLLIPIAVVGTIFWQRLAIFDAWRLYRYTPPAEITALADSTTMDDDARRLFYVYHPVVLDKTLFNMYCRDDEATIVLGCYRSGKGIYIYGVEDARLNGIKEVTAAHELLHAVYERLSTKDKAYIDKITNQALASITDERILSTVQLYREKDAKVLPNELHSILGTEVRNLPPELEAHYAKYFKDRSKVVGFSEQYEGAFEERENQIEAYDAQMKTLLDQINALKDSLDTEERQLARDRSAVEQSQSQAEVNAYNARITRFNNNINKVKTLIDQYNALLEKRNALALEEQDLSKAIDSRDGVPETQ